MSSGNDSLSNSGGPAETEGFREEGHRATDTDGDLQVHGGTWLPLNSRRLTKSHLQLIADTFGLPVNLSKEELRQQVDGKLIEMQREPGHVQVVLQETIKTELRMSLVDDSGVFETCGPTVFSSTAVRSQLEMETDHAEQEECIEQ